MAKLSTLSTFIFVFVAGSLKYMVNGFIIQVMKQGERLPTDFRKKYQIDSYLSCRVFMRPRGSLVLVQRGYEASMVWQSGPAPDHVEGDKYELQLGERGNMFIERIASPDDPRDNVIVYDTHTEGEEGEYFLGVRSGAGGSCLLEIREGTIDEPGKVVWANLRTEMSAGGPPLGTSEIYYDEFPNECRYYFMFMNPNGNLEVYHGANFPWYDYPPVWESNTKRKRGDYQFRFDENATLSLLDVATGEQYWKKDLQNSGHPPTRIADDRLILVSHFCEGRGFGPYVRFIYEDNVFMREGDKLPAGGVHYSSDCDITVHYDGRLEVIGVIGDNWFSEWSSGKAKNDTPSSDYFLALHETGTLAMYRGTIDNPADLLWETHTERDIGKYFLGTNEFCDLQVFEGTPEKKGALVWTNRVIKLQSGDRLIKGQYFTPGGTCGALMTLRPDNGVLRVYNSRCKSGTLYTYCHDEVWAYDDVGLGEYDDFYMEVGKDGKLRFYGVGEGGDELKGEFDLGDFTGDFEVTLCDESGSTLPKPVATYPLAV